MAEKSRIYELMHKEQKVGLIEIDVAGNLSNYAAYAQEAAPFLGNADVDKMKIWWSRRAVPGSRKMMDEVIKKAGCATSSDYLAKNLGLSMTDSYWVCPVDMTLSWEDVRLRSHFVTNEGLLPYHNEMSYDPNASLGGQMEKYWDFKGDKPVLVKTSLTYKGQQSVNETFATLLHRRQDNEIPYVSYDLERINSEQARSLCEAFTTDEIEFIPAYEVIESQSISNDVALYDGYIDICSRNGIDRDVIQAFMDYQTLTDFVISNTDEHLYNFGVLRDAGSRRLIGPAPIFDSGNSMFYSEDRAKAYNRVELLERSMTGFYTSEEKALARVKDKKAVKIDLLPDESEVFEFYVESKIPEKKAHFIARSYGKKVEMLRDFQGGKKISLYNEKKK